MPLSYLDEERYSDGKDREADRQLIEEGHGREQLGCRHVLSMEARVDADGDGGDEQGGDGGEERHDGPEEGVPRQQSELPAAVLRYPGQKQTLPAVEFHSFHVLQGFTAGSQAPVLGLYHRTDINSST